MLSDRHATIKTLAKKILPKWLYQILKAVFFNFEDYYLLPKARLSYAQDNLFTYNNADFLKEPRFLAAYRLGKATDKGQLLKASDIHWRIHVLCWAASHAKHLPGDFVDCGVNTGIYARAVMHYIDFAKLHKRYFLLDTFSGLDPRYSTAAERRKSAPLGYEKRVHLYEEVKKTFAKFNVRIIKGSIPETLNRVKTKKVCYLSIDMNCVQPEVAALEFFWDRLVKGGVVILDDYGFPGYHKQKQAHDAFAKSKGVKILTFPTCQGLLLKP